MLQAARQPVCKPYVKFVDRHFLSPIPGRFSNLVFAVRTVYRNSYLVSRQSARYWDGINPAEVSGVSGRRRLYGQLSH